MAVEPQAPAETLDDLGDLAQAQAGATDVSRAHEAEQAGRTERLDVLPRERARGIDLARGGRDDLGDDALERVTKDWRFSKGNCRRHRKNSCDQIWWTDRRRSLNVSERCGRVCPTGRTMWPISDVARLEPPALQRCRPAYSETHAEGRIPTRRGVLKVPVGPIIQASEARAVKP